MTRVSCIQHGSWGNYCGPDCEQMTKQWNEAEETTMDLQKSADALRAVTGSVQATYQVERRMPDGSLQVEGSATSVGMNPNVVLEPEGEDENSLRVIFKGKDVGVVWLSDDGSMWLAHDNRDRDPATGFASKEEAANWMVGW